MVLHSCDVVNPAGCVDPTDDIQTWNLRESFFSEDLRFITSQQLESRQTGVSPWLFRRTQVF